MKSISRFSTYSAKVLLGLAFTVSFSTSLPAQAKSAQTRLTKLSATVFCKGGVPEKQIEGFSFFFEDARDQTHFGHLSLSLAGIGQTTPRGILEDGSLFLEDQNGVRVLVGTLADGTKPCAASFEPLPDQVWHDDVLLEPNRNLVFLAQRKLQACKAGLELWIAPRIKWSRREKVTLDFSGSVPGFFGTVSGLASHPYESLFNCLKGRAVNF